MRDGCEQIFRIEMNEETVADMDSPENVIEPSDPIAVGPCETPAPKPQAGGRRG